ncbi:TetR/AcrR family transcriptional regulator [Flindersiella endophytica]
MEQSRPGLRERKKQHTRQALTDAALRLFAENGYDKTTVADIAAAADVSTRTFFSYFRAKEDVLFAGADQRTAAIAEAFDAVQPESTSPIDALRRLVDHVLDTSQEGIAGPDRGQRMAYLLSKPELQAQGLQRLLAAERLIAERLHQAYPGLLDDTLSHALSGAVVGALVGVVLSQAERNSSEDIRTQIHRTLALLENGLHSLR